MGAVVANEEEGKRAYRCPFLKLDGDDEEAGGIFVCSCLSIALIVVQLQQ